MKDNADIYTFKTGLVDGKVVDLTQLTTIANLPSKEELISKLLYVLNAQAQRIVTVINAVPRNLAVVVKQIGEQEGRTGGTPASEPAPDEPVTIEAEVAPATEAAAEPAAENAATATEAQEEAVAAAPDDAAEEVLDVPAEEEKPE